MTFKRIVVLTEDVVITSTPREFVLKDINEEITSFKKISF